MYMKSMRKAKFTTIFAILLSVTASTVLFGFGNSNLGYVDPNIYSGVAGNYRVFYDIFENSNSVMDKYSIFRIVHIFLLFLHQKIFGALSIITFQIMFILINFLVLKKFLQLFKIPWNSFSVLTIYWVLVIPTYILETRWNYVQVTGASLTLIAVYNLVKYYYTKDRFNLIAFGFFFSLLTNTHLKYTVQIIIFTTFFLIYSIKLNKKKINIIFNQTWNIFKGILVGQLFIEILFYLMVSKITTPLFIQTFITPLKLARMRVEGINGLGSYVDVGLAELLNLDYIYLYPIYIVVIVCNVLLMVKRYTRISESINSEVLHWIAILFNSIVVTLLISVYFIKSPMFQAYWYFNTIWPLYALGQLLILNQLVKILTNEQKRIFWFLISFGMIYLFFNKYMPDKERVIIATLLLILLGMLRNRISYSISVVTLGILSLQFLQPPVGNKTDIDFQQYSFRSQLQTIRTLEFASDQIWFSSLYTDTYTKQNRSVPVWYSEKSGLGDMQSSLGFCVTALHDCGVSGEKPDLNIWLNNNGYLPEFIVIMDTADQTSLRIARVELNAYGYSIIGLDRSPSLNFVVGIFESK
jgi:hypothetical protein